MVPGRLQEPEDRRPRVVAPTTADQERQADLRDRRAGDRDLAADERERLAEDNGPFASLEALELYRAELSARWRHAWR
jgi:hypothetical protein